MAGINFPQNPDVDDTFVVGDVTWRWDGVSWRSNSTFNGRMPAGTFDQRPADPKIGMIRYNTDLETFEGYNGEDWIFLEQDPQVAEPPLDISEFSFGDSLCGGIYMGQIEAAGQCYALIVAPNATGCAFCQWKTANTATAGTGSGVDGFANTYGPLDNADHPAGNWCATRTINGFSDWYLPAIDELETFYQNGATGSNESVIGSGEAFNCSSYWSSTEGNANNACLFDFNSGNRFDFVDKTTPGSIRAVRREPI